MMASLAKLALLFAGLSLLAIGGANSVVPEMQRVTVGVQHWMSGRDFLDLFAISRLAPGPGSLIVTLIGQRVAGPAGALVATLAMFGPSCLLVYIAAKLWHRARDAGWRDTAERGLAPVAVGLVFASALALTRGTESAWAAYGLTALATGALTVSEIHPLIVLAAGGAAGVALRL
jgi:chromate transporter